MLVHDVCLVKAVTEEEDGTSLEMLVDEILIRFVRIDTEVNRIRIKGNVCQYKTFIMLSRLSVCGER